MGTKKTLELITINKCGLQLYWLYINLTNVEIYYNMNNMMTTNANAVMPIISYYLNVDIGIQRVLLNLLLTIIRGERNKNTSLYNFS